MRDDGPKAVDDEDAVQRQIHHDQNDRQRDRLAEPLEKFRKRFSSIRMLPCPYGLISATRLYIGSDSYGASGFSRTLDVRLKADAPSKGSAAFET